MSNQNHERHESDGLQELDALSNDALWQSTLTANATRRRAVARLLVHLALIEERRLHLVRGYSSLYDLCVRCLGMSEGQAHRSVSGARAAKSFPLALEMIADGRLHLTGLSLIAKRLTPENHAQLLEDVAGKTKAEILIVLARRFPKPDVPDRVEPVSDGSRPSEQGSLGLDGAPRSRVEPLSEQRFHVHFSGSAELKTKLEHAQNLMSHVSRKLEVVIERALDALIRELENKQWGKTDRPRRSGGRKDRRPSRADKREVYDRDGAQCSYVSPSGVRCTARAFLQYDHVDPLGKGGGGEARNGRLLEGRVLQGGCGTRHRGRTLAFGPADPRGPAQTHAGLSAAAFTSECLLLFRTCGTPRPFTAPDQKTHAQARVTFVRRPSSCSRTRMCEACQRETGL